MLASKFKIQHNGEFSPNTQIISSVAYSNGQVILSSISTVLPCLILSLSEGRAGIFCEHQSNIFYICFLSIYVIDPFSSLHI
jgi:hypothetical protein